MTRAMRFSPSEVVRSRCCRVPLGVGPFTYAVTVTALSASTGAPGTSRLRCPKCGKWNGLLSID
jgi:hypothetical protein